MQNTKIHGFAGWKSFIIILFLFFTQQLYAQRIPKPALHIEFSAGAVFLNADKVSPVYNDLKEQIEFNDIILPPNQISDPSPVFSLRASYPVSNRFSLGFDISYIRTIVVNRYQDIYGSLDLSSTVNNPSYQFITRYFVVKKPRFKGYLQGGIGASYMFAKVKKDITDNRSVDSWFVYPEKKKEEKYGFVSSLEGGVQYSPGRLAFGITTGYRISRTYGDNRTSEMDGLYSSLVISYNVLK